MLLPLLRDGKVQYKGELYSTMGQLQVANGTPVSVMLSALAPVMLKLAGTMTFADKQEAKLKDVTFKAGELTFAAERQRRFSIRSRAALRTRRSCCLMFGIDVRSAA